MEKGRGREQSVRIRVNGYATMKRFTKHLPDGGEMEVPDDSTVGTVLSMLHAPVRIEKIAMINGRRCDMDHVLEPGDELVFFPPLEGG